MFEKISKIAIFTSCTRNNPVKLVRRACIDIRSLLFPKFLTCFGSKTQRKSFVTIITPADVLSYAAVMYDTVTKLGVAELSVVWLIDLELADSACLGSELERFEDH